MELSFAIAGIANTIFSLANSQKTRQILGKRYQNPIRKFVNFRGQMPTSDRWEPGVDEKSLGGTS